MILYSNSCSFGEKNQGHVIYPEVVAKSLGANLINEGLAGSCNRRIIRSSLRSLINLRKQNSDITALIGLSFIGRTELWQPHMPSSGDDGDFHSISVNKKLDWSNGLINTIIPDVYKFTDAEVMDYYKQWLVHMSKEAEVTNLVADMIMLSSFASTNNIKMLIFCNTQKFPESPSVDTSAPFLKNFVEYMTNDNSIIDPWKFSFADYALSLGYEPKDKNLFGLNGHPGEQAHVCFGKYLLDNYIH